MKKIIGFKTVTDDLKSGHGNITWKIGEWKKHEGIINLCSSGFHASKKPHQALEYLQGNRFFMVEARGNILEQSDKFVASEMRLVKEIKHFKELAVEYAIWNAKKALPNFEKYYPKDDRVRKAIVAAENWLKARTKKQKKAARSAASAAWSAAESAAWSATESAARSAAWSAASAAWSAAWSAAESAAWSAASAAESAAWSEQEKYFTKLVMKFKHKFRHYCSDCMSPILDDNSCKCKVFEK